MALRKYCSNQGEFEKKKIEFFKIMLKEFFSESLRKFSK